MKPTDEQKKEMILEMKAVTRRIEEDIRLLTATMEELGQTDIQVYIRGWHVQIKQLEQLPNVSDS